jgi:phosphatidate cytidylyltransferase|tara:strand:- start:3410 stop:4033 length:624 start_codon:yes stop_codon:yes gene_type:complete
MTNFQKRILTSLIALPLSIFFVVKGGYFLAFFLIFILFAGMHELFSVFKKIKSILLLSSILILSLFSIYYLSERADLLLYFVIGVTVSSDIGGYVFGKIFKWKKLTKISPKKTISGVFGSYFFSIIFLFIWSEFYSSASQVNIKTFLITIIFSTVSQIGDLIISYFKRQDKIKDTGKILPGHGGIFDRIDGLMFVVILASFINYLAQ